MTAIRFAVGTTSLSSASRLAASSPLSVEIPVTFPPGRARLDTNPIATGSPTSAITIGICLVAWIAARAPGVLMATRTSTRASTSSLARAGSRSALALRRSQQEAEAPSLLVPERTQRLDERRVPAVPIAVVRRQHAHRANGLLRLLRGGGKRREEYGNRETDPEGTARAVEATGHRESEYTDPTEARSDR